MSSVSMDILHNQYKRQYTDNNDKRVSDCKEVFSLLYEFFHDTSFYKIKKMKWITYAQLIYIYLKPTLNRGISKFCRHSIFEAEKNMKYIQKKIIDNQNVLSSNYTILLNLLRFHFPFCCGVVIKAILLNHIGLDSYNVLWEIFSMGSCCIGEISIRLSFFHGAWIYSLSEISIHICVGIIHFLEKNIRSQGCLCVSWTVTPYVSKYSNERLIPGTSKPNFFKINVIKPEQSNQFSSTPASGHTYFREGCPIYFRLSCTICCLMSFNFCLRNIGSKSKTLVISCFLLSIKSLN